MTVRRSLLLICLIAALHGLFFIWYQQPDWQTQWTDQDGYRRLGEVLATTGKFTRVPDAPRFVPEVIRTPVYPAFVAVVYRLFGVGQLPVALAQTGLFVLIVLAVFAIASRVTSPTIAIAASALTALFPPIPYFGALVMTEVWTTLLFTIAMWVSVRTLTEPSPGGFALLGVLLGLTTLSRPVFVLMPAALAGIWFVVLPLLRIKPRPSLAHGAVMLALVGVTLLPWFSYNYATLGRFTLSPAGGVGRGIWEGSWQSIWSGRLQNELTHVADDIDDLDTLDGAVAGIARRERLEPAPMLDYVHQWKDIRRIWTEPTGPWDRALSRVTADQEYLRVGLDNVRRAGVPRLVRRLARGAFILWAGEIPWRYSDINRLPTILIRAVWGIQSLLFLLALVGLGALARQSGAAAWLLAAPILYITAVHVLLLTEARQSLPAQPVLLVLAAMGTAHLSGHSLALEPEVHERQHL